MLSTYLLSGTTEKLNLLNSGIDLMESNILRGSGTVTSIPTGGVDPGIIRELSGTYKPFTKAFKEIISNSFDADASNVRIVVETNYNSIVVRDDGVGITPFELQSDYTKIGGSQARYNKQQTTATFGRSRIGSKGTGFLAVARYAGGIEIESTSVKEYLAKFVITTVADQSSYTLYTEQNNPISPALFHRNIKKSKVVLLEASHSLVEGKDFTIDLIEPKERVEPQSLSEVVLTLETGFAVEPNQQIAVELTIDCSSFLLHARINYDYLISQEQKIDLEEIKDFCVVRVSELDSQSPYTANHFTKIRLYELKPFIVADLKAPSRGWLSHNIRGRSGIERFKWEVSRCVPLSYEQLPAGVVEAYSKDNLLHPTLKYIPNLTFELQGLEEEKLYRPVFGSNDKDYFEYLPDLTTPIDINEGGLVAKGYILGQSSVINPAEFRGLTFRVRNVSIGSPNFLGAEDFMSGPSKAALNQITGEINILAGMDALSDINPGRESFYEESPHFKILRKHITGDSSNVASGKLGEIIRAILKRSVVSSSVENYLTETAKRRKALTTTANGVTQQARSYPTIQKALLERFQKGFTNAHSLAASLDFVIEIPTSLNTYEVKVVPGLEDEFVIDHEHNQVFFDADSELWDWSINLLGKQLQVVPKKGGPNRPICEFDFKNNKIYLNWTHPIKLNFSNEDFIRNIIAWHLAHIGSTRESEESIHDLMSFALGVIAQAD